MKKNNLNHSQRWFSWEDQTTENMENWYMIYQLITQSRTINTPKHSSKECMLYVQWNLKQKIIMIKVTHTQNKNGGAERDKSNEMSFAQTQKHEKSAIVMVQ